MVQLHMQQMHQAVNCEDGAAFGKLLSFKKLNKSVQQAILQEGATANKMTMNTRHIPAPYGQIISLHFRAIALGSDLNPRARPVEAFALQQQAADLFFDVVKAAKDVNWWLHGINSVVTQLRILSYQAANVEESMGQKAQSMNTAQDTIMKFFRVMINSRSALHCSKKMGCLYLVVHLFKIYFRINNLRLCTNLVRAVNNDTFPKFEFFPKSQTVAYHLYVGRLKVFEESYAEAESSLDYAFKHCHNKNIQNKRSILLFLIPVKLLLGKYPKTELLQKYDMLQFQGLIEATRAGNLKQFSSSLEENQGFFIRKGIFLILEKLKLFVYRNLFRKVYKFCATWDGCPRKNQISIDILQSAVRMHGVDMDADELECILANLIYNSEMKGYIAHGRCVVLSKADPFPTRIN